MIIGIGKDKKKKKNIKDTKIISCIVEVKSNSKSNSNKL